MMQAVDPLETNYIISKDYPDLPNRAYWFADDDGINPDEFINNPVQGTGTYEDISSEIFDDDDYYEELVRPLIDNNLARFERFSNIYTGDQARQFAKFFYDDTRNGERFFYTDGRLARNDGFIDIQELDDDSYLVQYNLVSLQTLNDLGLTRELLARLPKLKFIKPPPLFGTDTRQIPTTSFSSNVREFLCNIDLIEECMDKLCIDLDEYLPVAPDPEDPLTVLEQYLCRIDDIEDCESELEDVLEGLPDSTDGEPYDPLEDYLCRIEDIEDCESELEDDLDDVLPLAPQSITHEERPTELEEYLCRIDDIEDCESELEDDLDDNIPLSPQAITHEDAPTELEEYLCRIDDIEGCEAQLENTIEDDIPKPSDIE